MLDNGIQPGLQAVSIDSSGMVELCALSDLGEERISVVEANNNGELYEVVMPSIAQLEIELGCVISQQEILEGFRNAVEGIPVPLLFEITWTENVERTTIKSSGQ